MSDNDFILPEVGTRIRLAAPMLDDPRPIEVGDTGAVTFSRKFNDDSWQIGVKWDSGRGLMLVTGDEFEIIDPAILGASEPTQFDVVGYPESGDAS